MIGGRLPASGNHDLAAKKPEKVKQMQDLFYSEFEEVRRAAARQLDALALESRPSLAAGRTVFMFIVRLQDPWRTLAII